ncbi:hypothetical protein CP02DC15_0311B, partial [Chlamydia psittaci 02DC15]
VLFLLIREL